MQGCTTETKFNTLQHRVEQLEKNLNDLKSDVESVKNDSSWDRFVRESEGIAYLTPGAGGYSVIKTDFGPLTVTLDDIKAYANGSRVTLKFGNPTSASLIDVSATVNWGSVDEKGSPRNDEAKSKEISFAKMFQAGHWTTISIVLESVPPNNLGFVRVRDLKNKGILLFR